MQRCPIRVLGVNSWHDVITQKMGIAACSVGWCGLGAAPLAAVVGAAELLFWDQANGWLPLGRMSKQSSQSHLHSQDF